MVTTFYPNPTYFEKYPDNPLEPAGCLKHISPTPEKYQQDKQKDKELLALLFPQKKFDRKDFEGKPELKRNINPIFNILIKNFNQNFSKDGILDIDKIRQIHYKDGTDQQQKEEKKYLKILEEKKYLKILDDAAEKLQPDFKKLTPVESVIA